MPLFKHEEQEQFDDNNFEEETYILIDGELVKVEEGGNDGDTEKGNECGRGCCM